MFATEPTPHIVTVGVVVVLLGLAFMAWANWLRDRDR